MSGVQITSGDRHSRHTVRVEIAIGRNRGCEDSYFLMVAVVGERGG